MEDYELIIEILEDIFGNIHQHYPNKGQISFDCPVCSYDLKGLEEGDGKGNLEINYHMGVYKCWACSETADTHGHILKLIRKWGDKTQLSNFELVSPQEFMGKEKTYNKKIKLPYGFTKLEEVSPHDLHAKQAFTYLRKRNIGKNLIKKYGIGFTTQGDYKFRIIVPTYTPTDKLEYFVGRSYINAKLKYKNPEQEKSKIIFNGDKIDWEKDIFLVEGVFDMFFLDNSVPLLGKVVSDNLWEKLYTQATANIIICLDGDAWDDAVKIFDKLNGGKLRGRIRVVKMPIDKDIAELNGEIKDENILQLER